MAAISHMLEIVASSMDMVSRLGRWLFTELSPLRSLLGVPLDQ